MKQITLPKNFWLNLDTEHKIDLLHNVCKSKIFTCAFTKKNGEQRVINCRLGVTKHLKQGNYIRKNQEQYLVAYDLKVNAYRNISVDSIQWLRINQLHVDVRGD